MQRKGIGIVVESVWHHIAVRDLYTARQTRFAGALSSAKKIYRGKSYAVDFIFFFCNRGLDLLPNKAAFSRMA